MAPANPRCCGPSTATTPWRRPAASTRGSRARRAARGIQAGVAYVAPHLQTWHTPKMQVMEAVASGRYASIGLNEAITARRSAPRRARAAALRDPGVA
jgi:ABC-type molybdenum transport system ATPase subunit/photorepair protein PhrA